MYLTLMTFSLMNTKRQLNSFIRILKWTPNLLKLIVTISENLSKLIKTVNSKRLRDWKRNPLVVAVVASGSTFSTNNARCRPQVSALLSRLPTIVCSGREKILLVFQSKKYGKRWKRSTEPAWLLSKPFRSFRTPFMIEMTSQLLGIRLLDVAAP